MINLESLLRLRICPEGMPTMQEIYSLAARQPTDDTLLRFCEIHNAAIAMIGNLYFFDRGFQDDLSLLRSICDRSGFLYGDAIVHQARLIYYRAVFAGSPTRLETMANLLEESRLSPGVGAAIQRSRDEIEYLCQNFAEYRRSWDFWMNFERSIEDRSRNDLPLRSLVAGWRAHRLTTSKDAANHRQAFGDKAFGSCECRYCKSIFTFQRKQGVTAMPSHCGSEQCRREYETERKREQRSLGGSQDWQSAAKTPRRCAQCRKQKILNSERICKKCFSENLAQ